MNNLYRIIDNLTLAGLGAVVLAVVGIVFILYTIFL